MLFLAAFFVSLMLLARQSRRRMIAILLIAFVAILGFGPPPAHAQFCLPCVIQTVLTTVNQTLGGLLNRINQILTSIQNLYQQTVWPINAINQAKAQIRSTATQFTGNVRGIFIINPHSAGLPNPVALENVMRNRITSDVNALPQTYMNTFRPVPEPGLMAPEDRNMTDMDDAMAQDNLMILKAADQAQDLELQAADQVESLAGNASIDVSAPGTASLITAAAVTSEIKSQVVMQKMLAAMIRQESARLAHDNALRKRNSALANQVQNRVTNMLQHR